MVKTNRGGFSYIELMVAILVMSSAIVGIMALLPGGYGHVTSAGRISTLNHLGQKKLDYLRSLPFNHADLAAGWHPSPVPQTLSDTDANGNLVYAGYTIRWYVVADKPMTNMKMVTVEVGYQKWKISGLTYTEYPDGEATDKRVVQFRTYLAP